MGDDERQQAPARRPRRARDGPDTSDDRIEERSNGAASRRRRPERIPAGEAARRAASQIAELTDHHPESVIAIEPHDCGWRIGVEVVETRRIPDSADILGVYEVVLAPDGELVSYRRSCRYARGQLQREGR